MNLIKLSRKNILFVICCVLLTLFVAFLTSLARFYLFAARFDYDSIRKNERIGWSGPKEGERIELSKFRTEQGESFPQFPEKSLILLSVVDPKCEMCRLSTDLIQKVQRDAESHQVRFFIVSFVSKAPKEEFFRYANTICKSDGSYFWQGEKEQLLPALEKMVVPSQLLVNEKGTVLRRFSGSSTDKPVRDQMARQIITETLAEKAKLE